MARDIYLYVCIKINNDDGSAVVQTGVLSGEAQQSGIVSTLMIALIEESLALLPCSTPAQVGLHISSMTMAICKDMEKELKDE